MPQHAIGCVHQLANTKPRGLDFCNQNNQLMISEYDDMYDDSGDKSYNPAEDYDATDVSDVHNEKENATAKEDTDPYPGVPAIIGYGNGNDSKAIPAGVYHDTNDTNPILSDDDPSTGLHKPHIPIKEDLQIPGLILDTTFNTGVTNNSGVG